MFALLKSDLYRTVRSRLFWGLIVLTAVMMLLIAGVMHWISSPEFNAMVNQAVLEQGEDLTLEERAEAEADLAEATALNERCYDTPTQLWGQTFLNGGFLGIISSLFIALFLVADFKSGFIKNLILDRRGRYRYYGEKIIFIGLMQAVFLLVSALFTSLDFTALGFTATTDEPLGDIVLWLGLTWLILFAYALITACLVWTVRSSWVGSLSALLISSGMVGALVTQLIQFFAKAVPFLAAVPCWIPASALQLLCSNATPLLTPNAGLPLPALLPAGHILLVGIIYSAACAGLIFTVLRRRDIQ